MKKILLTATLATIAGGAQAATIVFDNTSADSTWETATNWDTDSAATGTDQIIIGSGFNVTRASVLRLKNEAPAGTLLISSGGSLTITGDLQLDQAAASVIIDGSLIFVSGGTKSNMDSEPGGTQGTYSLSGTMTFNDYNNGIASSGGATGAPLLDFVQVGATMEALGMSAGDFTNLDSKLNNAGAFFFGINGTQVNNTGTASDSTGADIVGGFYLARTDTANSSTLVLTAVPEPSSTALLGLGGLALILRRRK